MMWRMVSVPTPDDRDAAPIRLLIVDDDASIRMLLEVTVSLDPRFVLVGAASNAAETMQILGSTCEPCPADVVLLDVTLPDGDGIELLARVRAVAGSARVALFTGWTDPETIARARRAGADAIFPKDGDARGLLDGLAALRD